MGIATAIAAAAVVGGTIGGIGGNMKDKSRSDSTSGVNLNEATDKEKNYFGVQDQQFSSLQNLLNNGPGTSDYNAGISSQRDLAAMLGDYAKNGGLPSSEDISKSNDISSNLFSAQRVALNQSFEDQNTEAQRLAARLGRPVNDPILQAKLRTGFIRQQDLLNASQGATAQQLALQMPGQRLSYAQSQTQILSGLADQAVQNRNFLMGLGNQFGQQERDFRLRTSEQYSNGKQESGGGMKGLLSGMLGGAATGASAVSGFGGGGFGGFGGGTSTGGGGGGLGSGIQYMGTNYNLGMNYSQPMQYQQPMMQYNSMMASQSPYQTQPFASRFNLGTNYGG